MIKSTVSNKSLINKRVITALFFLYFISYANAQSAAIDSLNKLIQKTKSDTQKINLSNKLIYAISEINLDSSNVLAKKIISDAAAINYKEGEADALRMQAANFSRLGDYIAAEKSLRSAEAIIASLADSARLAKIYATYGLMYGMQGKYDTSIRFYQKSIRITERKGDRKDLGLYYGNIAIGYQMQADFSQALVYQLKSLKIAEQENDVSTVAYTQMNLGNTYQNINDTLRAEKAFLKGIELAKSIGIKNVELYGYSNIASLYEGSKRWNESYTYAMQSAKLAKTMGDAGIESTGFSKAAFALANMNQYGQAEILNKNAMAIADSSKQPFNILQVYANMGFILTIEGKYQEAIPFFKKSIGMLSSTDRYDGTIREIYSKLSVCYEKTGAYDKALASYKSATEISDSISSKENIRKTTELTLNNEFEKKQNISEAIQNEKNASAKLKQILLLCGLAATVIVAAGAWRSVSNKQKANQLLQKQKEEIQNTLSQLKATQSQLIQSEKMASLGELTAGIAHEIQNPLNFVNNFSELNTELIEEADQEIDKGNMAQLKTLLNDIKENGKKINHHGRRADAIVKGMLQHSRSSSGVKEPTDINALADEYLRLAYHGLRAKDNSFNATMNTDFDETINKINIIPQDIGRVLLNLYTNAFYAVNEKKKLNIGDYAPAVSVSAKKSGNRISITVSDNGNGIPQKVFDKIFQPFFTTKPTGQGTGLGLSLSYDIIKAHGGEIKVETKEGEGTTFIIQLPVV